MELCVVSGIHCPLCVSSAVQPYTAILQLSVLGSGFQHWEVLELKDGERSSVVWRTQDVPQVLLDIFGCKVEQAVVEDKAGEEEDEDEDEEEDADWEQL